MSDTVAAPYALSSSARVYVAGHRGMVGSAVVRALQRHGITDVVGASSAELDLRDREATFAYVRETKPDVVVLAAAKVGGILANSSQPVDFLSDNLRIQTNVMDAALAVRVPRLLFLGSSCIYPKFAEQPIAESALLTGELEQTNDAYAIAKIAGIIGVQAVRRQYGLPWISGMPTNLYGPNDNFSPTGSHLLPALLRRYSEAVESGAQTVTNWGTGTPRRELMHVDDMAEACITLLESYDGDQQVNIGTGVDHSIAEIAEMVQEAVGYTGAVNWDTTKPDGTPRKVLDVGKLRGLGWEQRVGLREGITSVLEWYRTNSDVLRE
ncbi:GDP-L-fucose synthase family protein [Gordonia iterans]